MNSRSRRSGAVRSGAVLACLILCLLYSLAVARASSAAQPQSDSIQNAITPSAGINQPGNPANDGSAAPTPTPERVTPGQALKNLFKFAITGAVLLMLVLGLTVKLITWFFEGRKKLSATRGRIIAIVAAAIIVPLALHFSFGSELRIPHGWKLPSGAIKEYNYWATFFFDPPANRYSVNVWGKISDLRVHVLPGVLGVGIDVGVESDRRGAGDVPRDGGEDEAVLVLPGVGEAHREQLVAEHRAEDELPR